MNSVRGAASLMPSVIVGILAFGVPLIYFPAGSDHLEMYKQAFVVCGAAIAVIFVLAGFLLRERIAIPRSRVFFAGALLVCAVAVSTVLSADRVTSIFGFGLGAHESLLATGAFAGIFFIVAAYTTNVISRNILRLFLVGGSISAAFSLLASAGMFERIFGADVSLVGTTNLQATFFASVFMGAASAAVVWRGLAGKFAFAFTLFLGVVGVVLFNSDTWMALAIVGAVVLVTYFLLFSRVRGSTVSTIGLVLFEGVLVGFALFSPRLAPMFFVTPEASLTAGASASIATQSLRDSTFFGQGPGNWSSAYAAYFPEELNRTEFWNIGFAQAGSRFLTLPVTGGAVHTVAWIGFVLSVLLGSFLKIAGARGALSLSGLLSPRRVFMRLFERLEMGREDGNYNVLFPACAAWLVLLLGQFVAGSNMVLEFSLWLLAGILVATGRSGGGEVAEKNNTIIQMPRTSLAFQFIIFVVILAGIFAAGIGGFVGKRYLAINSYQQAVSALQRGDAEAAIEKLSDAVRLEPVNLFYSQALDNMLINALTAQTEGNERKVREYGELLVATADQAATNFPNRAEAWFNRARVYGLLAGGTNNDRMLSEAEASWGKAIELSPKNPLFRFEFGGLNYAVWGKNRSAAEGANAERFELAAEENFRAAIELKDNYVPARFALGFFDYQRGKTDSAKEQLEAIVLLNPRHSDAHYLLGLLYEGDGNAAKALEEFTRVLELNPGNEELQRMIDNVRAGKKALDGFPTGPESGEPIIP